jgi:hypothetical protein
MVIMGVFTPSPGRCQLVPTGVLIRYLDCVSWFPRECSSLTRTVPADSHGSAHPSTRLCQPAHVGVATPTRTCQLVPMGVLDASLGLCQLVHIGGLAASPRLCQLVHTGNAYPLVQTVLGQLADWPTGNHRQNMKGGKPNDNKRYLVID